MTLTAEVQYLLGAIGAIIGSYWTYVIWKIDKNQSRLFTICDELSKQLHTLQGEHNMAVGKHFKKEE